VCWNTASTYDGAGYVEQCDALGDSRWTIASRIVILIMHDHHGLDFRDRNPLKGVKINSR